VGDRTFFSEVELAIMSERGPSQVRDINLANHFGYSEYRDGRTITINQNFAGSDNSRRFASGTWSSNAMTAVGLHLAGEYNFHTPANTAGNRITLDANIAASGVGAQGIRIENNNNRVTIAPNRTVSANGYQGVGVLVTRGANTTLINRGSIRATGDYGRGVWFNADATALHNSGAINAGTAGNSAILISSNARVPMIHFMQGTNVTDNIISHNQT